MEAADVLVVGSGCTGSTVAETLAEGGARVLMIDAGASDDRYPSLIPDASFTDNRMNDEEQHRYLLGDEFEALDGLLTDAGAQLTPPRLHVVRDALRYLAVDSSNFSPVESLAYGGLGAAWGLGCCVFSDAELRACGLPSVAMATAYQTIASRIGISGCSDDARPYTYGDITGIQPATPLNPTMQRIYRSYARKRDAFRKRGFAIGRPALALLTQARDHREASRLREMEFYEDRERAAWRPWIVLSRLRRNHHVEYVGGVLVTSFREIDDSVTVEALDMRSLETRSYRARRVVLATGTLGTARIVLRSLAPGHHRRLPLLCNPYSYLPSLVLSGLGGAMPPNDQAVAQLSMFLDANAVGDDISMASLYSYRSLMTFRLLPRMPLGVRDAIPILQYLQSAFVIAGLHQPDAYAPNKYIERIASDTATKDALRITFERTANERAANARRERSFVRALRSIGVYTVRAVHPRDGASIHYAGTLPVSTVDRSFSVAPDGRLYGTRSVYVADGSGFTYLPAKGLTLSLMANADRVARSLH